MKDLLHVVIVTLLCSSIGLCVFLAVTDGQEPANVRKISSHWEKDEAVAVYQIIVDREVYLVFASKFGGLVVLDKGAINSHTFPLAPVPQGAEKN